MRYSRLRIAEYVVVLGIFLAVSALLIELKMIRADHRFGDMTMLSQTTESIARRGFPASEVLTNVLAYVHSGLATELASQVAVDPLAPPDAPDASLLKFHAYLILYPIAQLTRFLPTDFVLLSIYIFSFTGAILLSYEALRRSGVSVPAACAFCFLVMAHPAWSEGLRWQFYPDRIFVFAGLLFMLSISSNKPSILLQVVAALLCLSIDERASITAGLFLLAYVVLYWRTTPQRAFKVGLSFALIAYGLIAIKFFLPADFYNASFLPRSLGQLIGLFEIPQFAHGAVIFLVVNCALWAVACFEWRAALIALLLMLPNVVGNIGGAEKLGWATHYHDEYLPALIWAALQGFSRAYAFLKERSRTAYLYAGIAALVLFLGVLNPSTGEFAATNVDNLFFFWFPREVSAYTSPGGRQAEAWAQDLQKVIPENSVVSTIEAGMPFLYDGRTLRFFPVGIDHADYAVFGATKTPAGVVYSGFSSSRGPEETRKINEVIVRRMKKDGYDFDHPKLVASNGLIVLQRVH